MTRPTRSVHAEACEVIFTGLFFFMRDAFMYFSFFVLPLINLGFLYPFVMAGFTCNITSDPTRFWIAYGLAMGIVCLICIYAFTGYIYDTHNPIIVSESFYFNGRRRRSLTEGQVKKIKRDMMYTGIFHWFLLTIPFVSQLIGCIIYPKFVGEPPYSMVNFYTAATGFVFIGGLALIFLVFFGVWMSYMKVVERIMTERPGVYHV